MACGRPADLPAPTLPEVAVAGRSNCGKSALVNALANRRNLARTSTTPGRTRQIVFFHLVMPGGLDVHLVDLPGYGYARVSRSLRRSFGHLVEHYLETREVVRGMLILMDIRRPLAEEERSLLAWMRQLSIRPVLVLTKADKLGRSARLAAASRVERGLDLPRPPLVTVSIHHPETVAALRETVSGMLL